MAGSEGGVSLPEVVTKAARFAGLTDGEGDPPLSARVAVFRPTRSPSETGDRRSEAILRPVVFPKASWNARKRPLSPWRKRRQVRAAAYRCVT